MTPIAVPSQPSAGRTPAPFDAVPVELHVAGPEAGRITAWVESTLGWQVVDGVTGGLVPPVCTLADVSGAAAGTTGPLILLLGRDDPAVAAATAAAAARPAAVVEWPGDRDRLPEVVAGLVRHRPASSRSVHQLTVGGAAGGVGTTTVALALGGLHAWSGTDALVVTHGAVPLPPSRSIAVEDLGGDGLWEVATRVRGVPGLRVVRCPAPAPAPAAPLVAAGSAAVVRDVGITDDADVLVVRRDGQGLRAVERTAAAAVVVADTGPVPLAGLRKAAGGRRLIVLPWSVRVARAGALERVPSSLPGAWLRPLVPLVGRRRRSAR